MSTTRTNQTRQTNLEKIRELTDLVLILEEGSAHLSKLDDALRDIDNAVLAMADLPPGVARRDALQRQLDEASERFARAKPNALDRAIEAHVRAIEAEIELLKAHHAEDENRARAALRDARRALAHHPALDDVLTLVERRRASAAVK